MASEPVPANSLSPCPFGGNPKVAAQMGFPSCGIARPGPFFPGLNLGKQGGGRKSHRRHRKSHRRHRKSHRKSRRGGQTEHFPQIAPAATAAAIHYGPEKEEKKCPEGCEPVKKGVKKGLFGLGLFGLGGGRKSRRRHHKSRRRHHKSHRR